MKPLLRVWPLGLFLSLAGCGPTGPTAPLPQPSGSRPATVPQPAPRQAPAAPAPQTASDPLDGVPPSGRERNRWVQQRLNDRGYTCGIPDGRVGRNTRSCIQAFRVDNGLSDTTDIDDALLALLNTP